MGKRGVASLLAGPVLFGAVVWLQPVYGQAGLEDRVLVVYNSSASDSLAVARYYMAQRHIPESNRCRIAVDSPEYVKQGEFESRVKGPIRKCLETAGKQKILYVVFSYQTPYAVTVENRVFALDSFVADIWDEYADLKGGNEAGNHPYFGDAQSQGNVYMPFIPLALYRGQPQAKSIYSVWRLDAASAALAKGLVDKAMFAEANGLSGKACFDLQYKAESLADYGPVAADLDLHQAAEFARRAGFAVIEDETQAEFGTSPAPARCDGAALYAGWYSLNHYNDAFTWNPGAIGFHLDSASATNPRGGGNWSANAVLKGITITSGAVAEPYLEGLPHPDQVFLYLFQGANVGDAFLRSTRWLKWMILNIGDPLYRPFPKGAPSFNPPGRQDSMLALAPQGVAGGNTATGIVGLGAPAPEGGTVVALKSERPEIVRVPKTVTVPAKAVMARFPVITSPVNEVTAVRVFMAAGEAHRSNTLVLHPCMQPLALSADKVTGAAPVVATLALSQQAPAGGTLVKLSSDHPALVIMPPEVQVAAGTNQAAFQISTRAVTAETKVAIMAAAGGCTRTASLVVVP